MRPGDPALFARLAEAQSAAGDTEAAKQSAQAALAIDPHRREALRTLAFLAMNNRDYDQALPWLRQLAAESPNDRTVQVELGRALAQTGDSAEALRTSLPRSMRTIPTKKERCMRWRRVFCATWGVTKKQRGPPPKRGACRTPFRRETRINGKENADQ